MDTSAEVYFVVHKGRPSAAYDASCSGVWLLMEDIYENRQWHSSNVNDYANSTIHACSALINCCKPRNSSTA